MKDNQVKFNTGGVGLFGLLGILFIALKLTGVIGWSWWLVLLPFWGPLLFVLLVMFFTLVCFTLASEGVRGQKWK